MPYGTGPIIRQAVMRATPWQRYLVGVAMVIGGVALVALGRVTGGLLAVAGAFLLWRMVRGQFHRPQATPESRSPGE
jgi:nitrogen fixation-related uncharacterized protein